MLHHPQGAAENTSDKNYFRISYPAAEIVTKFYANHLSSSRYMAKIVLTVTM